MIKVVYGKLGEGMMLKKPKKPVIPTKYPNP